MADEDLNFEDEVMNQIDASITASGSETYGSEPSEELAAGTISQDEETAGSESAPKQDQQGRGDDQQRGEGDDQQQQQESTLRPATGLSYDQQGNLVDSKGQVLINAGGERRIYEHAQRLRSENDRLNGELTKLREDSDRVTALNNLPREYNLSDENVRMGLQLMRDFSTNPVAAARTILSAAMQTGVSLGDIIGQENAAGASSLDMAAISKMLDERLGGIEKDRTERQKEVEAAEHQAQVRQAYDTFLATHEHSDQHQDAIARLMEQGRATGQTVTASEAYWQLRAWASDRGLDFSKPLREQIDEHGNPLRNGGDQQQQQPQSPAGMPSGRGQGNGMVNLDAPVPDAASQEWDDIVADELRRHGVR